MKTLRFIYKYFLEICCGLLALIAFRIFMFVSRISLWTYDIALIRPAIEGAFGALVIFFSFLVAIFWFLRRRPKRGLLALSFCLTLFATRSIVTILSGI